MQKSILYALLVSVVMVNNGAVAETKVSLQQQTALKLATIAKMYQQDVDNEGMDYPVVLQQYSNSELKAAFELEQEYFDRQQMSCNIGHDVLWDSQDPDYAQDKQFAVTETGLVKVSLAQGSNIYYELSCNDKECQIADVILDNNIYGSETLKTFLTKNCV